MKVLDLFAGIGGFSLGLERAGHETVGFVEWNPHAQEVLRRHWPEVPILSDITEVTYEVLQAHGIVDIDVISGGFPCTDLSQAAKGSHLGFDGKASGLVYEFGRLVAEVKPEWVLIENVPQVKRYKKELEEIFAGYCLTFNDTDALDYGAYCRRKRTFIIGHLRARGGRTILIEPEVSHAPLSTGGFKDSAPMLLPWKGGVSLERLSSCLIEDTEADPTGIREGIGIPRRVGDSHLYLMLGNTVSPLITEVIGKRINETRCLPRDPARH